MELRKGVIEMSFHATLDVSNDIRIELDKEGGEVPLNRRT